MDHRTTYKMECEVKKITKVYLALEEKEALWLKNYLQNSQVPDDENEFDSDMRREFFNILKKALM